MNKLKLLYAVIAALAVAAVGVAGAIAAGGGDLPASSVDTTKSTGSLASISELPIFATASIDPSGADKARLNRIAAGADGGTLLSGVDTSAVRLASIAGSTEQLLIAASGKDGVCLFVPANGGYNSACGTVDDIEATGMLGVSSGATPESVVAYEIVPAGGPGLKVTEADGTVRTVPTDHGVAATVINPTDRVTNGVVAYNAGKIATATAR